MFNGQTCNIKITQCLIIFGFTIYVMIPKSFKKIVLIKNWDICMDKKSCTVHCITNDITVNQWEFGMACIIKMS